MLSQIVALGVEYDRTGLWVFVVPSVSAFLVMVSSWVSPCLNSLNCSNVKLKADTKAVCGLCAHLQCFFPGICEEYIDIIVKYIIITTPVSFSLVVQGKRESRSVF